MTFLYRKTSKIGMRDASKIKNLAESFY